MKPKIISSTHLCRVIDISSPLKEYNSDALIAVVGGNVQRGDVDTLVIERNMLISIYINSCGQKTVHHNIKALFDCLVKHKVDPALVWTAHFHSLESWRKVRKESVSRRLKTVSAIGA